MQPVDVVQAAEHLQSVSRKRRRDPNYGQTGVLRREAETTWRAFVTFAPWALDATVWAADHDDVASLADCSHSIVLRLTDAQRAVLKVALGPERLVPLADGRLDATGHRCRSRASARGNRVSPPIAPDVKKGCMLCSWGASMRSDHQLTCHPER
jgi:hypothetical protein